jgi:hypothetical protein
MLRGKCQYTLLGAVLRRKQGLRSLLNGAVFGGLGSVGVGHILVFRIICLIIRFQAGYLYPKKPLIFLSLPSIFAISKNVVFESLNHCCCYSGFFFYG